MILRELETKEVDKRKSLRRRVEKTFEGYPVKKHYKYLVIRIDGKGGARPHVDVLSASVAHRDTQLRRCCNKISLEDKVLM